MSIQIGHIDKPDRFLFSRICIFHHGFVLYQPGLVLHALQNQTAFLSFVGIHLQKGLCFIVQLNKNDFGPINVFFTRYAVLSIDKFLCYYTTNIHSITSAQIHQIYHLESSKNNLFTQFSFLGNLSTTESDYAGTQNTEHCNKMNQIIIDDNIQ